MHISYDKLNNMSDKKINSYNVITEPSYGEYEEKKSKFLAYLSYAQTEEEALAFIASIKKKHYDARHNCSAFIIGDNCEIVRSSDDGEPSGTAGKPMLEVLNGQNLRFIVAVVTRYFGGVLLGTGGLVRAYEAAVKDALSNASIAQMTFASDISIKCDYKDINNIQYYLSENSIRTLSSEYSDSVLINIRVKSDDSEMTIKKITELTQGKALIEIKEQGFNPL